MREIRNVVRIVAAAMFAAGAVQAQHLFTLVKDEPHGTRSFAVAGDMGPELPPAISVNANLDLLRSRPALLRVPSLTGGSDQVLHLRHFEDRGDGNVTWSGSNDGVTWEGALFTTVDGVLVGHYGAGDHVVEIRQRDGETGTALVEDHSEVEGPWCEAFPSHERGRLPRPPVRRAHSFEVEPGRSVTRGAPASVKSAAAADHDYIDIALAITDNAWDYLDSLSSVGAEISHFFDFGNMVLRNTFSKWSDPPIVRLHIRGIERGHYNDLEIDARTTFIPRISSRGSNNFANDVYALLEEHANRTHAFRNRYGADLVHVITRNVIYGEYGICGVASILEQGEAPEDFAPWAFGVTDLGCGIRKGMSRARRTFIHEIGHNMGLNHHLLSLNRPKSTAYGSGTGFGWLANPYLTESRNAADPFWTWPDSWAPGAVTTMSYKPVDQGEWRYVPFFSSPTIKIRRGTHGLPATSPKRWKLGHDTQGDSARVLAEAAPHVASLSDHQYRFPMPPTHLKLTSVAFNEAAQTAEIDFEWRDNSDDEYGFVVVGELWSVASRNGKLILDRAQSMIGNQFFGIDSTSGTATYQTSGWDGFAQTFFVQALGYDGPTLSNTVIVTDLAAPPLPAGPPTKPVILTPDFQGHGKWCIPIRINQDDTESYDVRVYWEEGPYPWDDHATQWFHDYPANKAVFCFKSDVGDKIDMYAVAKNQVGTTKSSHKKFYVKRR